MKLLEKIGLLLRTRRPPAARREDHWQDEPGPLRRPTPMEFGSLPLDPRYAWGIVLEPVDKMIQLLNDFIEQLALEAYHNGEGFEFSREELEPRFLAFFDRLVEERELQRLEDAPPTHGRSVLGPRRWIRAQQIRIKRLVDWWRLQDGPDIEAKLL